MKCREFTAEFEERANALSQTAQLHLNDCPDCKKTSGEQTRVWQMIDGLRRVDAPNDFDFRVKARIANAKPTDFQPRFFPVLRYVLPLSLVVLILGLGIFTTTYFSGKNPSPIAETVPQTPNAGVISSSSSPTPEQVVATANSLRSAPSENTAEDSNRSPATGERGIQFVAVRPPKKSLTESRQANPKKSNGGGSRDFSSTPPESPRLPLGLEQKRTIEPLPSPGNQTLIADAEILEFIGIETVSESGGRKVKAIKPKSLAERSGVKTGDIIEAIDGKQIGGEPFRMETVEIKKLTVVRGAEKIEIVLQNKAN